MRVVVDTNVVVSRYLTPRGIAAQVLVLWEQGAFELLVSEQILEEYRRVLAYPKIATLHQMNVDDIETIIADFREMSTLVEPVEEIQVIAADPDDDKWLSCASAGGADYIVSGDHHVLTLGSYKNIPILSPAVFVAVVNQAGDLSL